MTYNRDGNAVAYDFIIEQGATLALNFTYKNSSDKSLITEGTTARMKIKNRVGGTLLETFTTENGRISLTPASGLVAISMTATDTAAISAWDRGVYDLELEDSAGTVKRLLKGVVTLSKEITD